MFDNNIGNCAFFAKHCIQGAKSMKWWKIILTVMALSLFSGTAFAEPKLEVAGARVTITEGLTDAGLAQIKTAMGEKGAGDFTFTLEQCSNTDLAKLYKAYPEIKNLVILRSTEAIDFKALAGGTSLRMLLVGGAPGVSNLDALASNAVLIRVEFENLTGEPVDLGFLAAFPHMGRLMLNNLNCTNTEALAKLEKMTELILTSLNTAEGVQPVDLSFLPNMQQLTRLNIAKSKVDNFEAVDKCAKLRFVELQDAIGVQSLASLKALPALKSVTVKKDAYPESELQGFGEEVKVIERH